MDPAREARLFFVRVCGGSSLHSLMMWLMRLSVSLTSSLSTHYGALGLGPKHFASPWTWELGLTRAGLFLASFVLCTLTEHMNLHIYVEQ